MYEVSLAFATPASFKRAECSLLHGSPPVSSHRFPVGLPTPDRRRPRLHRGDPPLMRLLATGRATSLISGHATSAPAPQQADRSAAASIPRDLAARRLYRPHNGTPRFTRDRSSSAHTWSRPSGAAARCRQDSRKGLPRPSVPAPRLCSSCRHRFTTCRPFDSSSED